MLRTFQFRNSQFSTTGARVPFDLINIGNNRFAGQHPKWSQHPSIEILLCLPLEVTASHKIFHQTVLQRMVGDHHQTSTWSQCPYRLLQHHLQGLHLAIHLDTNRLKQFCQKTCSPPRGVTGATALINSLIVPIGLTLRLRSPIHCVMRCGESNSP